MLIRSRVPVPCQYNEMAFLCTLYTYKYTYLSAWIQCYTILFDSSSRASANLLYPYLWSRPQTPPTHHGSAVYFLALYLKIEISNQIEERPINVTCIRSLFPQSVKASLSQFVPCCSSFAAQSDYRTSLLKRKHNNVISWVHITYSQHTILHQPAIGRQQQSPTLHFSMWAATMCT